MGKRRRTTHELVAELRDFNHNEAATRLDHLAAILLRLGLCEHCGRTDCERNPYGQP